MDKRYLLGAGFIVGLGIIIGASPVVNQTVAIVDATTPTKQMAVNTDGSLNATLAAGTAVVGHVIADSGSTTAVTQATASNLNATATQGGTWTVQPGNTANTTAWIMQPVPGTTNGLSTYFVQPAASDNHVVIKNGAGIVYQVVAFNNSATVNYMRLYDAGTGFNGCNSATNLVTQFQIPASTSVGGFTIPIPLGLGFTTGISICVTSAYATTDTTAATASAMSIMVGYK